MINHINRTAAGVVGCVMAMVGTLSAASLDGSQTIGTHVAGQVAISLEGGNQNVAYYADTFGTGLGGWDFGDKNGDGIRDDAVDPAGLIMGAYSLQNSAGGDIRLKLNGGNIASSSGSLSTANTIGSAGHLVIRNAGTIAMGDGHMSAKRDGGTAGITIGEPGLPVGDFQAASVDGTGMHGGYGSDANPTNAINLYGSGDVLIQNSSGIGGLLMGGGAIRADDHLWNGEWPTEIAVQHVGRFHAGKVTFGFRSSLDRPTEQYSTVFNGAVDGESPTGSFVCGEINGVTINSYNDRLRRLHANHVVISGYTAVNVGTVRVDTIMYVGHTAGANTGNAGSISITNITGDIVIAGAISAWNASLSRRGSLILQAAGRITLSELGLDRFARASFSPGTVVDVRGPITGTDGTLLAGDGTTLLNGGSVLRLPAGRKMIYRPDRNPGLLGGKYVLADLSGTAGEGGLLMAWSPAGTVVALR